MKHRKLIGRLSDLDEQSPFPHDEDYQNTQERKVNRGLPNDYSCIADEGIRMLCTWECRSCWYGVKL